jgi:hypothetical protein
MSTVKDLVQLGASAPSIKTLMGQVLTQHGIGGAAAQHIQVRVSADTAAAQAAINALHGKDVKIGVSAPTIPNVQAAVDALHGKTITISVQEIVSQIGAVTGSPGGVPYTAAGAVANSAALYTKYLGHQTGWRVPGFGGGDIFPAMLEPGEAVVPKHLVSTIAPFLGAHNVPGFASGGIMGDMMNTFALARDTATSAMSSGNMSGQQWQNIFASFMKAAMIARQMQNAQGFSSGGSVPWLPTATYDKLRSEWETYKDNVEKSGGWYDSFDQWYTATDAGKNPIGGSSSSSVSSSSKASTAAKDFAFMLTGQIAQAVKSSSGASSIASALLTKLGTEISYAKSTSASAVSGLNLAGMDVTPGTGNGTVQEQMQSYLGSIQSFTTDLKSLSKEGLSKGIISQLVAAGPVQGDALAQSIMSSYGGVGMVNKLWSQIGSSSNKLGAQAAMSEYGGIISPNLKSATVTSNSISININAGSGATLSLSTAQIKALTEEIQAALLKQAKRNPKTGLKLTGKGS